MIEYKTYTPKEFWNIKRSELGHDGVGEYMADLFNRVAFSRCAFENYLGVFTDRKLFITLAIDSTDDKVVGMAKFGEYGSSLPYYFALSFISIDESYKGQGLSKSLMEEMFKFIKENNLSDSLKISTFEAEGIERNLPKNFLLMGRKYGIKIRFSEFDHNIEEETRCKLGIKESKNGESGMKLKELVKECIELGMFEEAKLLLNEEFKIYDESEEESSNEKIYRKILNLGTSVHDRCSSIEYSAHKLYSKANENQDKFRTLNEIENTLISAVDKLDYINSLIMKTLYK